MRCISATQQHVAVFLSTATSPLFAQFFQFYFSLHNSINFTIRNTIHNSICGCIQFRTVLTISNDTSLCKCCLLCQQKMQELLVLHFSCSQLPILPHGHLTFLHCVLHSLLTLSSQFFLMDSFASFLLWPLSSLHHGKGKLSSYNVLPKWTSYNASVNKRVETAPIPMSYLKKAQGFDAVCNPARWVQACTHRSEADNQPRAGLDWVSGVLVINASTKPPSRRDNTTH